MTVSSIDTASPYALQSNNASILDKNAFLKLLVAQMQNQDPLNPLENTEFTAQLAQFSSLEELYNINDNLKSIELYQASENNSQAVNFIGKEVVANGDEIQINNGSPDDIRYDLASDSSRVYIGIYDSNGYLVRDIITGAKPPGAQTEQWDGKDNEGNKLPNGIYTLNISAIDENELTVPVNTYITGEVTGVTFDSNTVYLMLGNKKVTLNEVIKIKKANL